MANSGPLIPLCNAPNPSLNADVPHAWADARRSGPPVS
jgi:hypothetical protein